ncbi:hypothetical protein GUITHDRAFT_115446 [Guillardia theta CCMP2712]|uniref:RWP-RK domain-containing protein n=1 Tax=Guillardia theta (strain CCMP2712) TaxID=905079 RepID=L1IQX1_GUITC|nr:hypothetical protein GUITHDRAFT_115446 [Guillardia theta CCMP2712]EKX38482.1 hypothetical protein GUITHDRAFT_115446 [Guillardia theta CCMP2712]|eukprot:XP_005825462.1 hypothetical protein GUITHDRAFT_115446 [Guillardia theta CCMP2712]
MYPRVQIFPRRKQGEEVRSKPVFLSESDVSSLFHLRQPDAANQLGISVTALKNACRRLGITEWPYKKKPMDDPSESQDTEAAPSSPAATSPASLSASRSSGSNSMLPTTVMFDRTSYLPQPQMPSLLPQNYAQVCASSWPANPTHQYVKDDATRLRDGQLTYATLLNPLQLPGGGGPTSRALSNGGAAGDDGGQ